MGLGQFVALIIPTKQGSFHPLNGGFAGSRKASTTARQRSIGINAG
ncbi:MULTISPECIES: hypothetical protein [unclassified Prochlorococcus]|nr:MULTISPECIES: hypothetical protein [unclassified Prochlorococcus]KGG28607.1 hypothetical protein EV13_1520 [Prochlorococcus sp. MIT 0702]KGG29187.1 hypothetical protein EV12_0238 [Prochlorococcus sp. MIT 0701]KGG34484.1 hypothetical protein EV14_1166 [Prochlorococcus sp. MIT 0703]